MKYLYYKSEKGNFGDDLNPWLWSQFFGPDDENDKDVFLGIGTILFNDFKLLKALDISCKKIVFGTGIRPNYKKFTIDHNWDVRFLRGPLSAGIFNNEFKFIADAAYAMRLVDGFNELKNTPKKYEVGLMPYFNSMKYFDWQAICNRLGYKFISPYSENGVEATIKEIASCKHIITEAMHGAIVADILRVPWRRYVLTTPTTEGSGVSEFKWLDWQQSIGLGNIDTTFITFYKPTVLNGLIKKYSADFINAEFFVKKTVNNEIFKMLSSISEYNLSADSVIDEIDKKIGEEISLLKSNYSK